MFKDYNMNQLILPLDLEMKLQENDIAFSIWKIKSSLKSNVKTMNSCLLMNELKSCRNSGEVVNDYTTKIENTNDVIERKRLRSERKTPKQIVKQVYILFVENRRLKTKLTSH